jgi:hypothetical protein
VDVDADVDADAGGDFHPDMSHGFLIDALSFFHIGRVPFMLICEILFCTFGITGAIINFYVLPKLSFYAPWMHYGISVPAALIAGLVVTKSLTALMSHYIPTSTPGALRPSQLEGSAATVISVEVNERFGRAMVDTTSAQKTMVFCRMMEGEPPVAKSGRVLLVSFDSKANMFQCSAASPGME